MGEASRSKTRARIAVFGKGPRAPPHHYELPARAEAQAGNGPERGGLIDLELQAHARAGGIEPLPEDAEPGGAVALPDDDEAAGRRRLRPRGFPCAIVVYLLNRELRAPVALPSASNSRPATSAAKGVPSRPSAPPRPPRSALRRGRAATDAYLCAPVVYVVHGRTAGPRGLPEASTVGAADDGRRFARPELRLQAARNAPRRLTAMGSGSLMKGEVVAALTWNSAPLAALRLASKRWAKTRSQASRYWPDQATTNGSGRVRSHVGDRAGYRRVYELTRNSPPAGTCAEPARRGPHAQERYGAAAEGDPHRTPPLSN